MSQVVLLLNVVFVVVVVVLVNRMLRAASKFNWNPGDSDLQNKQKFIILKAIIAIACIALFAAVINAFLG